jgi:tetratricopeptide (TPR) repeat protein
MKRRCVFKIGLALLGCVGVAGQNPETDCLGTPAPLEHLEQGRPELDAWLDSLDRSPCPGPRARVQLGTISARSLAHKPLPKARREFDRGIRAHRKGLAVEALEHFVAAARLDPEFLDAHAWAGLVHVEAGQPSQALAYYQQALRLEPTNAALLSNLAAVLLALDRPVEAESAGRRAVKLAPDSVEAHYMLGLALYAQKQETQETVAHLTIAVEKYSHARELLARIQLP